MPDTSTTEKRRGPKPGRQTPRSTVTRWDRTAYKELRFSELTERIRDAEQGNVERWIDTTRRMLKTDPDLVSVVNTRLDRVASARYEVLPPEVVSKGQAEAAKEAAELVESYCFRELPDFEQVIRDLLDGIGTGFAVAEIVWARRLIEWKGRRVGIWAPQDIIAVHPRRLAFTDSFQIAIQEDSLTRQVDGEGGIEGERVRTRSGMGILLPPDKYIVHQPRNILDYPTSTGLYMAIARQWWVKQWVTKYWLGGAERAANPRMHGTYPQQASDDVKNDLFNAIESMAADGIGVSAEETNVTQHAGSFEGAHKVWDGLAQRMAAMYAKAWLGSTLNVEVGDTGGNRALGESQADTTMDPRMERDGKSLWGDLRRFLIEPFLRFNSAPIGDVFNVKPPVSVGRFVFAEDPVEVDDAVINSGFLKVNQLLESRGLPPLPGEVGDRFVQPLAASAPFFPSAPAPRPEPDVGDGPEAEAPEGLAPPPEGESVQETALNGAQVTSLLAIVTQVAEGTLPRQTAVEIIVSAFPIDRQQADRILGEVGRGFTPATEPEEVAESPAPFPASHGPKPWELATKLGRSLSKGAAATSSLSKQRSKRKR